MTFVLEWYLDPSRETQVLLSEGPIPQRRSTWQNCYTVKLRFLIILVLGPLGSVMTHRVLTLLARRWPRGIAELVLSGGRACNKPSALNPETPCQAIVTNPEDSTYIVQMIFGLYP